MNRRIYIIVLSFIVFAVPSCIDEIDLNIDTERQFIIVNGLVSDVPDTYHVKLDYSPIIGVGNDNILTPVPSAQVVLKGDNGSSVQFFEKEDDDGLYEAFTATIPGVSYELEINTPDGLQIKSSPTLAPEPLLEIDTLKFDISIIENFNAAGNLITTEFVDLLISLKLPPDKRPYIRWRIKGEYKFVEAYRMALNPKICYVKENIDFNNIAILNTEDVGTDELSNFQLLSALMNDRFNQRYCFHVFQYGISEEEYLYWKRVKELINIDGTLFDPPPGSIVGNLITDENSGGRVQGYFSVVSQKSKRLFVDVTDKGTFAESVCSLRFNANNPQKCFDCLTINGSSYTKPTYWIP